MSLAIRQVSGLASSLLIYFLALQLQLVERGAGAPTGQQLAAQQQTSWFWSGGAPPSAGSSSLLSSFGPSGALLVPASLSEQSARLRRQAVSKKKKKAPGTKMSKKRIVSECLAAHNKWRRLHRVPELEWDDKLAAFAQKRSDHIAASDGDEFGHPPDLVFGENLFWHSALDKGCDFMVRGWYDEIDLYDFGAPTFAAATGHFTQLVWRGTTRVGCAFAQSTGPRGGLYLTCNYDPPGNFVGEFDENVPRPSSRDLAIARAAPPPPSLPLPLPGTSVQRVPSSSSTTTTSTTTSTTTTTTTTTTTAKPQTSAPPADGLTKPKTKKKKNRKNKKKKGNKKEDEDRKEDEKDRSKKKNKKNRKGKKKNKKSTSTTPEPAAPLR